MTIKHLYPNSRPTLDLKFAKDKKLDPRITFSRASSGTYVDENGLIQSAASGAARFDHDPVTGESLGLLVEEARSNNLPYSEQFDDLSYTKTQCTVVPYFDTALSGAYTSHKIIASTNNTYHQIQRNFTAATSSYTLSVFAKSAGYTFVFLQIGSAFAHFNLSTGAVAGSTGSPITTISSQGNGWWRCSITVSISSGTQTVYIGPSNATNTSFVGDGTSGILAWGAQLESGSFPTSYIPTPATFTSRASTATYYDSSGVIQTAAIDVARDDAYFPDENGVMQPAGLLLEGARTNIKTNSQVFTSGWNRSGIDPITQNTSITTPEGLTDGVGVITESSGGTVHQIYSTTTVQYTGYYTYSIFVKPNGRNYVNFCSSPFTHNLSDGTTTGSPSGEFISAKTEKFPNGWYRCSLVRLHNNTIDQFLFKLANGPGSTSYSGDGVSGVYIWGAQQEVSTYATSYIPTSGSTVTRAADVSSSATVTRSADVASITGSNFSSWYRQDEGTFFVDSVQTYTSINKYKMFIDNTANNDMLWMSVDSINRSIFRVYDSSNVLKVVTASETRPSSPNLVREKHSGAYISGDSSAASNGSLIVASTDDTFVRNGSNRIIIGNSNASNYLNGYISRLTYYPTRLSNAILQTLTS